MSDAIRSLADSLRRFGDDRLAALLTARRDLAAPIPHGIGPLAARAAGTASARRALGALTRPELQLVDALAVLPDGSSPAAVASALGAAPEAISAPLERLITLALVWGEDELHLVRAVREAPRAPGGLAPAHPQDPDPQQAEAIAQAARTELGEVAERLASGPARLTGHGDLARAVARLGLARPGPDGSLLLLRPVHLALRAGRVHPRLEAHRPAPAGEPLQERVPGSRTAQAVGAAFDALRVLSVMRELDDDPPGVLQRGGLPQRDLRRLAQRAGAEVAATATVLQTAWQAGLIGHDGEHWRPTRDWDLMRLREPEERWGELVLAWANGHRLAACAGSADPQDPVGSPRALLSDALRRDGVRTRRLSLLRALREAPAVRAREETLRASLAWAFPLAPPAVIAEEVAAALAEGEVLGLLVDGALSALGQELVRALEEQVPEADARLAGALAEHAPPAVHEVLVDADGTCVVPGRPAESLRPLLDWTETLAHGAGLTLRLTSASIRAGLGAGRDPEALLELLREASPSPLPQAVEYLVADESRRHARIEVARASTVLSAEAEVIDRLLAAPEAAALRLRRIAPTVAITQVDAGFALQTARRCGLSPAAVGPDGRPGEQLEHTLRGGPVDADLVIADAPELRTPPAEVVARIRAADAGQEAPSVSDRLLAAIAAGEALRIGVVDGRGGIEVREAVPLALDGGRLRARTAGAAAEAEFTVLVHRVVLD